MIQSLGIGFSTVCSLLLLGFGLYTAVKTRGFAFRSLPKAFRRIRSPDRSERPVSPFRAFITSLSGTVGVGNITGVAVALAFGGAGSVFWMWVSALLCMGIKQFEITLALRHQPKEETNYAFAPMLYVQRATESKEYAALFALFGVFSALVMGNMLQTVSAAEEAKIAFSLPSSVTAALFAILTFFFLRGGIGGVMRTLERVLPILGVLFLITGLGILAVRLPRIPEAIARIFREAFSFAPAAGGIFGTGIARGFRFGTENGLFSHEAGLGSGGLAHGACGADAKKQGLCGIVEVFLDTAVLSTVSALVILVSSEEGATGTVLSAAHGTFGNVGAWTVATCLMLFALLSVFSWGCYGETCFVWLCGRRSAAVFRILYPAVTLLSVFLPADLWGWSRLINGAMMILNVTALIALRGEMKHLQ